MIEDVNKYYNGRWKIKIGKFTKLYVFWIMAVSHSPGCYSALVIDDFTRVFSQCIDVLECFILVACSDFLLLWLSAH